MNPSADVALLPVIPLKEMVIFPGSVIPFFVTRPKPLAALEAALAGDKLVFLVAQKSGKAEHPGPDDLYQVGTAADVIQVLRLPDGTAKALVEGLWVGRIESYEGGADYVRARVGRMGFFAAQTKEVEALRRSLLALFEQYASLSDKVPEDLAHWIKGLEDPLHVAHAIGNYAALRLEDKQAVLEAPEVGEKLRQLSQLLSADIELLQLENKILSQVRNQIGKSQKEYFLNEQLKVIEKELGLASEEDLELEDLQERIRRARLPEPARDKAYRELHRLSRMAPLSPEATVSRTYIEWLTDLPWVKLTKDRVDLERAQRILDEDHYGLKKAKERIIEHLAVHQLVKHPRGPILCFVGPPGVGKTSLARSIARSLKRRFVRISLGGMRDEAEIRGHRRTYIGSLPGRILQSMKKAGSLNPVFLLDEVDKMSSDFRGDPASALLEVLDPEQNKAFNDHYIEVDFDLSHVMFITTANTTAGIPFPLMDRMEIIRLPGYTEDEKRAIAERHLIPKQIKAHGLSRRRVALTREAIDLLIRSYTHEAGVRNLEREIASICRKVARSAVSQANARTIRVGPPLVREYLGPEKFHDLDLHEPHEIGVACGLAWTDVGGELLPVETTLMPGRGTLTLTGKLGEVMQESAKAALSYIRTRYQEFGLEPDFFRKLEIHVHVPEGAIPKDGPSAGVTIAVSMLSALARRPARADVAMTGEITLRGRVIKIGGLKEKAVAAHRARIKRVIIPKDNEPELEEIPSEIREALAFLPVRTIDEVLPLALVPEPTASPPPARVQKTPRPPRRRPGLIFPPSHAKGRSRRLPGRPARPAKF